jgi:hypothetical protein
MNPNHSFPFPGRTALVVLCVALSAGCDRRSPTATSPEADIASRGTLDFSCGVSCSYEGEAMNMGAGCAIAVRGVTRLLRPNGSEIARDEWQLEPGRRINAQESFLYGDCCFSLTDVSEMGSYTTEIFWDSAPCG